MYVAPVKNYKDKLLAKLLIQQGNFFYLNEVGLTLLNAKDQRLKIYRVMANFTQKHLICQMNQGRRGLS